MKQSWHHLHCVGDGGIVPDLRGVHLRSANELAAKAQRRIRGIVAAMPDGIDWSGWMIDVHDAGGRHVAYVAFMAEGMDGALSDDPAPASLSGRRGLDAGGQIVEVAHDHRARPLSQHAHAARVVHDEAADEEHEQARDLGANLARRPA